MRLNRPLIKVNGVPNSATTKDLYTLFSSVAQIDWIHLNRNKKSAILSLYDKSSTDFVLAKQWIYDESTLRLKKHGKEMIQRTVRKTQNKKLDEPLYLSRSSFQSPKLSLLQEYHKGKSKFWVDVPHEKAVPVKSSLRYRYRYKRQMSAGTGAKIMPTKKCKKTLPVRSKRKLEIPKLEQMSYEAFIEELNSFSLDQQYEKQNPYSSELENKGASASSRKTIQLLFKSKSTFTLSIDDRMNITLEDIASFVQEKDKIHADMQLLLYEGHILQEDHLRQLKNGDCIHVLCRGIGGMQSGSPDEEGMDITEESSEDEVQKWLMDVVHVPSTYRDNFSFLDGKSIFICQNYTDLSKKLSIPIGLARKVFFMRSRNVWFTNIDTSAVSAWSIDDLHDHLKNVKYPQLKNILKEKCIDGLTFLTYSFSSDEEIKQDLNLQAGGLHLRLWTESKKLLMQYRTAIQKTVTSEGMPNESGANDLAENNDQVKQSEQPIPGNDQNQGMQIPFDASVDYIRATKNYKENVKQSISVAESLLKKSLNKSEVSSSNLYQFLQETLCLSHLKTVTKDMRELKLVLVGSPNRLSKQNDLEKAFLFFILYDGSKIDGDEEKYLKFLWQKITEKTNNWVQYLPALMQENFKYAKGKEGAFNVRGNTVKLSKCYKRHYVKQMENYIHQYQHFFLLVDDYIFEDFSLPNSGYKVYLDERGLFEYGFCFDARVKYLTFSSRNFAGFIEKHIKSDVGDSLFSQAKNHLHLICNEYNVKPKVDQEKVENEDVFDKNQVNPIKPYATQPEASDGQSYDISENRSLADNKANLKTFQDSSQENSTNEFVVNISSNSQTRRCFKSEGSKKLYHRNWVLDSQETGSGMMIPSVEFKYFSTSFKHGDENEPIKKFIYETLRFACGCLNRRRNGTIYFGVADGGQPIDGIKYRDGEIIGFPIHDYDHCTMKKYIDELDNAIEKYIEFADAKKAAKQCIKSPEFIEVTSHTGLKLFVMEVDIDSSIVFCKHVPFYFNCMKLQKEKGKKTKRKDQSCFFVRDGPKTLMVTADVLEYELKALHEQYDKARELEELRSIQHSTVREQNAEKLYRKICMGQPALNKSLWPILILTKPDDVTVNNPSWLEDFNFIKSGQWVCIFDFNDCSDESGIFGKIFPNAKATVTNEEKFKYHESVIQLKDELQFPEKVVWIFSNGRKELGKAHKDRKEWNEEYSSGIKGAVHFFHQRSVIPENRAIIILFLLSDDFAGVSETLYELVSHFGWNRIVIIAEKQETFDKFKHVIESERSYYREELDGSSVVGMSWKAVASIFEDAMGIEIENECKVPSSSGAMVIVDPRFLEHLKDLNILSATMHENVKLEKDVKVSISYEKEKKFYQGNRVDWWNFFFETHVLKRHCFSSLRQKVQTALTSPRSDQQKIITITIIHEPGAGGSTLARHILWEFRKEFKCAILERLTENSCVEIFELWKMFESDMNYAKPVLILVDDLSNADANLNELYRKIHFMYLTQKLDTKTALPVCVLLKCRKEDDFRSLHEHERINEDVTVLLRQKLVEMGPINEKEWCENKYREIEQTGKKLGLGNYAPEHLIAFMILRSDFNMEFINSTIESLLKNVNPELNEFKLLKYASLLFSYVESHNEAVDIYIPLECCDLLMSGANVLKPRSQRDYHWEYSLHEAVKILLRIEDKQFGSGRQIKMAHQNLAHRVLAYIKNKTKQSTADIALEYLNSDLLNNYAFDKKTIDDMTKEMLIRRKKEEYSDCKTTKFSPLVEDMQKESPYQDVASVLSHGYEKLKDGMIAQQVARIYIHEKDFDKAQTWADTARSTAPQRSDFIHTCGQVMREKFSHLLKENKDTRSSQSEEIISLISIALHAIDIFSQATVSFVKQKAGNNVFVYVDTIETILQLLDFVSRNIKPLEKESDLRLYLVSPDFIPKELPDEWKPFHEKFKSFYDMSESAFRHLEDIIFCHTTFYERKHDHTKERKEHRSNRHVKSRLPALRIKFISFFGEKEIIMKDKYLSDPDMRNSWYRRKLIGLRANSFIQIFDTVALIKKRDLTTEEAKAKLLEAKQYLSNISPLTDFDLANKISVNVALALLKAPNRESTASVFNFCKELVNLNGEFLHVAYFFVMIILWPNKDNLDGVQYNDKLFHKAVHTLGELFNTKKEQMLTSKTESMKFKQEHNIFRATTQFFLTHGKGLQSVCHRSELFLKDHADSWDYLWASPPHHKNLVLLHGVLSSSSKGNFIIVLNQRMNQQEIKIRNSYRRTGCVSEERVTFYLGFSFEGLVAYGVKPNSDHVIGHWMHLRYTNYNEEPKEQLLKKINRIVTIRAKREKNDHLNPDEQQLLEDEEDIRNALLQFEDQYD